MFKMLMIPVFMLASAYGVLAQQQELPWEDQQEAEELDLDAEIRFGTNVEDRELIGEEDTFPAGVERVYAWTVIEGAERATTVSHIWELDGNIIQQVDLDIDASEEFRTWSYKTVGPEWAGDWTVRVVDEWGNELAESSFTVEEPEEEENDNGIWPDEWQDDNEQEDDQDDGLF